MTDLRSARACLLLACLFVGGQGIVESLEVPDQGYLALGLSGDNWNWSIVWQSVTYAFIHGNLWHLSFNLAALMLIGSRVERIADAATVLKVFLVGVVLGGLAQLAFAPPDQRGIPLVGASGGISALLLWLTTASPESRTWPLRISGRNLGRGMVLAEAVLLLVGWWLPAAGLQGVAHACHLGGALGGWWLARRLLRPPPSLDELKKQRARRESADGPGDLP